MNKKLDELSTLYIENSIDRVENKNIYPENIYTFFNRDFRQIDGWDEDWYVNFNKWKNLLMLQNFIWQKWIQSDGFENIFDFEYFYKINLNTDEYKKKLKQPICDLNVIKKLNPQYCSQLVLDDKYE